MDILCTILSFIQNNPKVLAVLISALSLTFAIFKFTAQRADEAFEKAVLGLANDSATVRSISMQTLTSYLTSFFLSARKRYRQNIVAQGFSSNLIHENNRHVRSECALILQNSHWQIRRAVIMTLYEANLQLWESRNEAVLSEGQWRDIEERLQTVRDTLAALLKKRRLRGLDLRGVHLDFCTLIGANLKNCNLTQATLTHANFKHALLSGAKFNRAVIVHSYLSENNLDGADFTDAFIVRNHFDNLVNYDCLGQAGIRAWNKYQGVDVLDNHASDDPLIVMMERELDWDGLWVTDTGNTRLELRADWRSPHSAEAVTGVMRLEHNQDGQAVRIIRSQSSDGNNGIYEIEQRGIIETENFEVFKGTRSIVSCVQPWRAVRWSLKKPPDVKDSASQ